MRCGVDSERQSGHDCQTGLAKGPSEALRVALALSGRVSAADHSQRRACQQFELAVRVEQRGRICDFEQRLGIGLVREGNHRMPGLRGPFACLGHCLGDLGRIKGLECRPRGHTRQLGTRPGENLFG